MFVARGTVKFNKYTRRVQRAIRCTRFGCREYELGRFRVLKKCYDDNNDGNNNNNNFRVNRKNPLERRSNYFVYALARTAV